MNPERIRRMKLGAMKASIFLVILYSSTHTLSHLREKIFDRPSDVPGNFKIMYFVSDEPKILDFRDIKETVRTKANSEIPKIKWNGNIEAYGSVGYEEVAANGYSMVKLEISDNDTTQWFFYEIREDGKVNPKKSRIMHASYMLNSLVFSLILVYIAPKLYRYIRGFKKSRN